MKKTISVVIPSSWQEKNLKRVLRCLQVQTIKPDEIFVLIDKVLSKEQKKILTTTISDELLPSFFQQITFIFSGDQLAFGWEFLAWKGVSYVRNSGIKLCKSEFIQCFDDDVFLDPDFFAIQWNQREKLEKIETKKHILIPTIYYRSTKIIQTLGIQDIIFRLWRPLPITKEFYTGKLWFIKKIIWKFFSLLKTPEKWNYKPKMIASISLFGPASVFKKTLYDERFEFIMEDYDFSYRCFLDGIDLIVSKETKIYHFERDKSLAEQLFVATPAHAFQKAQNLILFMRKNASLWQKIQFFSVWLPIWIIYFSFFICFNTNKPLTILSSLRAWLRSGFTLSLSN